MTMGSEIKINLIIHCATFATGMVGAGFAQLPCSDACLIGPIQKAMIQMIAQVHGRKVSEAAAAQFLLSFTAWIVGREISRRLVGLVPVSGNVINAMTAATFTETIGWMAHAQFSPAAVQGETFANA